MTLFSSAWIIFICKENIQMYIANNASMNMKLKKECKANKEPTKPWLTTHGHVRPHSFDNIDKDFSVIKVPAQKISFCLNVGFMKLLCLFCIVCYHSSRLTWITMSKAAPRKCCKLLFFQGCTHAKWPRWAHPQLKISTWN